MKKKKQNKDKELKEELKKISSKLNDLDKKILNLKKHHKIETNSIAIAGMFMAILFTVIVGIVVQDVYYMMEKIDQKIIPNFFELFRTTAFMVILFIMIAKSIVLFNSIRIALYREFEKIESKKKK